MRSGQAILLVVLAVFVAAAGAAHADIRLAPGQPLDQAAARELLKPALTRASAGRSLRVRVDQPSLPLANPYQKPAVLAVTDVHTTVGDGFVATVEIRVGDREPLTLRLSGTFAPLVGVPVPAATIAAGTILEPRHFETLWLAQSRVRGEWLATAGNVDGHEAYRTLVAGQPVAADAVGSRRFVRRGEPVTIVLIDAGLKLEAAGTARADGGLDDVVEAKNDRSGAVVTGRVVGPSRIRVELP